MCICAGLGHSEAEINKFTSANVTQKMLHYESLFIADKEYMLVSCYMICKHVLLHRLCSNVSCF